MNHQGNMPPPFRQNFHNQPGHQGGGMAPPYAPPMHSSDMHSDHQSHSMGMQQSRGGGGGSSQQGNYSQSSNPSQINQSNANLALSAGLSSDKSARSIFVGNIPYEATEEKLIDLFGQAGPVVSFRLVFDRESGKPKGYGFCEYADVTVANSALRNLHNIEFNGRPLRIGPAAGEQNSAEVAMFTSTPSGPPQETPYGDPVDPKEAPEAISRAVASLPPEQMFDLMIQMKHCVQRNPAEARNMLLQNPQLAYALLQAQIVMKIVDPKVAIALLNRGNEPVPPIAVPSANVNAPSATHKPGVSAPASTTASTSVTASSGVPQREMNIQGPVRPPYPPTQGRTGAPDASTFANPHSSAPRFPQPPSSSSSSSAYPTSRPHPPAAQPSNQISAATNFLAGSGGSDQDKAALVMQVLQLSDDQIAMLPEDQRRSIMILKEQIGAGSRQL